MSVGWTRSAPPRGDTIDNPVADETPGGIEHGVSEPAYAERIGEHHGVFANGTTADLDRLVRNLGGRVDVASSFSAAEALTVYAPGNFVIHLPPMTSDRRDRFTIAHELGHYFLHYLQPDLTGPETFGRGSRSPMETQANYFAAALLMPSERFTQVFRRHRGDSWSVADAFGVSPRAVEVRAQVLGIA